MLVYRGVWSDATTLTFTSAPQPDGSRARVAYVRRPDGSVLFSASRAQDGAAFQTYFEAMLVRK